MAISLQPLNELDPAAVKAALDETVQRISEDNPNLELRRGVFNELLAYYHAVLDSQRRKNIADYLAARSLKEIEANPDLADPDLVDDVLSNFRLDRKAGSNAGGEVTVVVSSDVTVTIAQGSVWEARGRQYVTPEVYTAKAEEAQIVGASDRLLAELADGNFAFTISVEAVETGADSAVKKDTLVAPISVPPNYVTSYATSDFDIGLAVETNEELLARLQEGIAAKALSNRVNMSAALRAIDDFSRIVAMSIIGHGDAELVRAYHSILPIALTGRCDWYVRAQEPLQAVDAQKSATLVEKLDDGTGIWQFGVTRSDFPGFYEVRNIRPVTTDPIDSGYAVVQDVRGLDTTGDEFIPDILTATEAAYSSFSTTVIQFLDTTSHAALSVGATRPYDFTLIGMPLIGEVQGHVSSRDVRPYGGDCLVKAPVPCFVSLNFTINKKSGQADPDLDAIKASLCAEINTLGFIGAVYGSQLHDAIHGHLTDGQTVSAIDMLGRIRHPDSEISYLRDGDVLQIGDDPGAMVTPNTVQFFAEPGDIGITVVTKLPTNR